MKKNLQIAILVLRIYQVVITLACSVLLFVLFWKGGGNLSLIQNSTLSFDMEEITTIELFVLSTILLLGGVVLYIALQKIILILKKFQAVQFFEETNAKRFRQSGLLFMLLSALIALFPFVNGLVNNQLVLSFQLDGALLTFLIGTLLLVFSSVFERGREIYEENQYTV